ncbi:MAG TPA: ATP12 family protein [Pseudolabrys sp.]|nr:ATP12 family protein [Pseudolabrys sp.]
MRDIFDNIFENEPLDPVEAARRNMRPNLRKRFYKEASAGEADDSFPVLLDGRPVRTPARRALAAPSRALAQAIADEWNAQQEVVDPARMPLTRLANAIIDAVADKSDAVNAEIGKYLASDLLFYRAEGPEGLLAAQAQHWDPVLTWAHEALGAHFVLAQGVVHVAQPQAALAAAIAAIPRDPWRLGALSTVTSLTGSALLALALAADQLSVDAAWAAAHVDEDWQMAQWGRDTLALERRAFRFAEMQAAATVLRLAGSRG